MCSRAYRLMVPATVKLTVAQSFHFETPSSQSSTVYETGRSIGQTTWTRSYISTHLVALLLLLLLGVTLFGNA